MIEDHWVRRGKWLQVRQFRTLVLGDVRLGAFDQTLSESLPRRGCKPGFWMARQ